MLSIYPDVGAICQFNHISEHGCVISGHLQAMLRGVGRAASGDVAAKCLFDGTVHQGLCRGGGIGVMVFNKRVNMMRAGGGRPRSCCDGADEKILMGFNSNDLDFWYDRLLFGRATACVYIFICLYYFIIDVFIPISNDKIY